MTDATATTHDDGPPEGPIKTPKQLIVAVLYAFIVPIAVIVLLVMYVGSGQRPAAGSSAATAESVAQRIRPVGLVEVRDATDLASLKSGEQVYAAQCTACHSAGVAGAPKLGDAEQWAPRIKSGYETLLTSALKGKGAMGPQGGGDFSDLEIGRAVVYMTNKAGASFEEPKTVAAEASAGSTPSMATAAGAMVPATAVTPATPATGAAPVAATTAAAATPAAATTPAVAATTVAAATAPNGTAAVPAAADGGAAPALYAQACQVCHGAGIAGAPKTGDKAGWAPRLALGVDGLTASAIKGKGAMPPRGGSAGSDADIKAVVVYMVNSVK